MINYIDDKWIENLSNNDINIPLNHKIIKLQEEVGELSQAFLAYDNCTNKSKSSTGTIFDLIEELCDVINVSMDIMNSITQDDPKLEMLARIVFINKLTKWENKQND